MRTGQTTRVPLQFLTRPARLHLAVAFIPPKKRILLRRAFFKGAHRAARVSPAWFQPACVWAGAGAPGGFVGAGLGGAAGAVLGGAGFVGAGLGGAAGAVLGGAGFVAAGLGGAAGAVLGGAGFGAAALAGALACVLADDSRAGGAAAVAAFFSTVFSTCAAGFIPRQASSLPLCQSQ